MSGIFFFMVGFSKSEKRPGATRAAGVLLFISVFLSSCTLSSSGEEEWELQSPDGTLQVIIANGPDEEGKAPVLRYRVSRTAGGESREVIGWSPLGITRDDADFSKNLEFLGKETASIEDEYTMLRGKQRQIDSEGNEISLTFQEGGGDKLTLIFRAYNDGVAFRYRFPEEAAAVHTVTAEQTGFRIAPEGEAWLQPYDVITKYTPAYERFFSGPIPVGQPAPGKEGWTFPALFQTGETWILLTESDLDENYFAGHLNPQAPDGLYTIRMPEREEAMGLHAQNPGSSLPWQTPWRVAIIGDDLGSIVESTLITDLATPSVLEDTSWIVPGRSSWSWWSDHPSSREFVKLKSFVDLAAEMGWEYSLVDANWNTMEGGNIEQLIEYANDRNVGILMWYNSGGPHNTVEEQPRDRMLDRETRRAEFAQLRDWGVRGIKVDFFQSDKQALIGQYIDILKDAADYEILVNFHGCTIPRGWDRTYPHLLTLEAVRGGESYSFDENFPQMAPSQNTIYAFTRNVIGPMDYTPVTFSDNVYPHITTNAHELALAVVFESGILHYADRVSAYQGLEEPVKSLLKELPVTWDETHFISGTPGKDIVIARRAGGVWYLAGINGEGEAREFQVDLSFTGNEAVKAMTIRDGTDGREFVMESDQLYTNGKTAIPTLAYGGFLMRIE